MRGYQLPVTARRGDGANRMNIYEYNGRHAGHCWVAFEPAKVSETEHFHLEDDVIIRKNLIKLWLYLRRGPKAKSQQCIEAGDAFPSPAPVIAARGHEPVVSKNRFTLRHLSRLYPPQILVHWRL
jgi:hypothetical protein